VIFGTILLVGLNCHVSASLVACRILVSIWCQIAPTVPDLPVVPVRKSFVVCILQGEASIAWKRSSLRSRSMSTATRAPCCAGPKSARTVITETKGVGPKSDQIKGPKRRTRMNTGVRPSWIKVCKTFMRKQMDRDQDGELLLLAHAQRAAIWTRSSLHRNAARTCAPTSNQRKVPPSPTQVDGFCQADSPEAPGPAKTHIH
jgi:hypothetical protein